MCSSDLNASAAFAMCDHQVAHVYVQRSQALEAVRERLAALPGVQRVLGRDELESIELDHPRSGDLVLLPEPGAWFAYPWWSDDAQAPDYARTVDIHRKPGYDPVELFVDGGIPAPKLKVALTLLRKLLGFRYSMNVIGFETHRVRGKIGRAHV